MSQTASARPASASRAGDADPATSAAGTLHVAMAGWMVAGVRTHYENMRRAVEAMPDVVATPVEVSAWQAGGLIERLPVVPRRVRSNMRSLLSTAPLFGVRPLDVVWTQPLKHTGPYLFTWGAARRIPIVHDTDCTPRLLRSYGEYYAEQVAGSPVKHRLLDAYFAAAARRCAGVICWSEWARRSFVHDYAVPAERTHVIPPGVDIAWWTPAPGPRAARERPRLLFVGGDFARKGGDLLLDVWQRHFAGRCELHLVTRDDVPARPGVFVYRDFSPNDPGLRALYHAADALALPTRGDCFSLASIEAMAAGLPVITSAVGGIPEIVEGGVTGYLIAPGDGAALRTALERLLASAELRSAMGARAQAAAASRFDAARNAQRRLDLLRDVARRRTAGGASRQEPPRRPSAAT